MLASIDIGTNSVRLFIGQVKSEKLIPLVAKLAVTRLGQGVDSSGCLAEEAINRTVAVLCEYRDSIANYPVKAVIVMATSAVRDAANREDFVVRVQAQTGWKVQVLTGSQEAAASFLGAIAAVEHQKTRATTVGVLDIGGGSTELIYGSLTGTIFSGGSGQVGAVRMTEACISKHPVSKQEQLALERLIDSRLQPLVAQGEQYQSSPLIGVGGTVTTIAALELQLNEYSGEQVTGRELTIEVVYDWYQRLAELDVATRLKLPGMTQGREDVIVAGVAILYRVLRLLGVNRMLVSDGDLLQGIIYQNKREKDC